MRGFTLPPIPNSNPFMWSDSEGVRTIFFRYILCVKPVIMAQAVKRATLALQFVGSISLLEIFAFFYTFKIRFFSVWL